MSLLISYLEIENAFLDVRLKTHYISFNSGLAISLK